VTLLQGIRGPAQPVEIHVDGEVVLLSFGGGAGFGEEGPGLRQTLGVGRTGDHRFCLLLVGELILNHEAFRLGFGPLRRLTRHLPARGGAESGPQPFQVFQECFVLRCQKNRPLAGSSGTIELPDGPIGILQQNVKTDLGLLGVVVGQEHQIGHPAGGLLVAPCHGRLQEGFPVREMFRVLREQVLGVEHPVEGTAAGGKPLLHVLGRRFGPMPRQSLQGEDPKLDMPPRDVIGREPKALQVGIDGAVEITRLGRLAGSVEVRSGLRLCWSIRFRHSVVKWLSWPMIYHFHRSIRPNPVNE
jgi:hypothetical protein